MMTMLENLHRLASRQDENFLTEALIGVLRELIANSPCSAAQFVSWLTGNAIDLNEKDLYLLDISTQYRTPVGIPDIVLTTGTTRVYIEVKVDSPFEESQLTRYRSDLDKARENETNKSLCTLTRDPVSNPDSVQIDCERTWYWGILSGMNP